ncbi:alkyl hydroperoxide reductase subunit C-like protein [Aquipluma nitroreducens]|uniref:Alkyl hydroperoxide reductase subunit C-like protein n=1 Tax=Aquipluma nitroreducens TaxID=2010828 RepID=A0A5K7S9T8_9BACT|nr:redoxin domain-containing protein [Aquipluma nitroreducens]BBE18265.1 alkyl hydroperoxide reductase subunit C-like protein [Aquipluma nitroreducens]
MDNFFYLHEIKTSRIGDQAPAFRSVTTQGTIYFPADYFGRWVILFSYSPDFAPESTSVLKRLTAVQNDFKALNCEIIGVSVDGLRSLKATSRSFKERTEYNGRKDPEIKIPLIEDITMEVAIKYGMIPSDENHVKSVRWVFIIDPQCMIRSVINSPLAVGLNFNELKRVIVALQTEDAFCDKITAVEYDIAGKHIENQMLGTKSPKWFLCTKELSEEKVMNSN